MDQEPLQQAHNLFDGLFLSGQHDLTCPYEDNTIERIWFNRGRAARDGIDFQVAVMTALTTAEGRLFPESFTPQQAFIARLAGQLDPRHKAIADRIFELSKGGRGGVA
ncbi:hypothetical protein [Alloalcanivorax xenomutans]